MKKIWKKKLVSLICALTILLTTFMPIHTAVANEQSISEPKVEEEVQIDIGEEDEQKKENDEEENTEKENQLDESENELVEPIVSNDEMKNANTRDNKASSISRFELLPNKEKKMDFLTGEETTAEIALEVKANDPKLNGSKIVLTFPNTDFFPEEYVTLNDITGQSSRKQEIVDGKLVVTYTFNSLNAGTLTTVPIGIKTHHAETPDGFKVPITAVLLNSEDEVIIPEQKIEYNYNLKKFTLDKKIMASDNKWTTEDKAEALGGTEDKNNSGYLMDNKVELVPVEFSYLISEEIEGNIGNRFLDKYIIEDIIPEGAVFDPAINDKNWTYDETTRTAKIERNAWRTEPRDFATSDQRGIAILKLYFPGAKLNETLTNDVKITGIPKDRVEGEKYLVFEDSIDFKLVGRDDGVKPSMTKVSDGYKIKDTEYSKNNDKTTFTLEIKNPYDDRNLSNISIVDDGLDEALKITEIRVRRLNKARFTQPVNLEVDYYDGTTELLVKDRWLTEYAEDKSRFAIIEKVSDVKSFKLTSEGGELTASQSLIVEVDVMIRDPENTKTNGEDELVFNNTAKFKASYAPEVGGELVDQEIKSGDDLILFPSSQASTRIRKRATPDQVTNDTVIDYSLMVFLSDLNGGDHIDYNKIVDILPKNMDYVPDSSVVENKVKADRFKWDADPSVQQEPEIVENYKGTGRTALIWNLSKLTAIVDQRGETKQNEVLNISYKVKPTIFTAKGENRNQVYLSWKNVDEVVATDDRATEDIYDLNENGRVDDEITRIGYGVFYNPPNEMRIFKEAKGSNNTDWVIGKNHALGDIGSEGSYNIKVENYSETDHDKIYIIDILPHIGDKSITVNQSGSRTPRGSEFTIGLSGPIEVPTGWTVHYTEANTDEITDMDDFYQTGNWITDPTDYSKVTGFKLEMISGKLGRGEVLAIEIPVTLPKDTDILNKVAYNTYGIKFELNNPFFESNSVGFTTTKYLIEGNLFEDVNLNNLLDDEDKSIVGHKVELVDANGDPVNDFAGNPIVATTDANGHYKIDIYTSGDYKVKVIPPVGFKAIESNDGDNGSHIVSDNMTDVFTIDINNDHIIKNAGYVEVPEPDATTIDITGIKKLEGRALKADEFTFELKDENDAVIKTAKNEADGSIKFTGIEIPVAGEYKFTVTEVDEKISGITYSTDVYNVKVTATVDSQNKLETVVETTKDRNTVSEVVFKNMYTKPVTPVDPVEPDKPIDPWFPFYPSEPQLNKSDHNSYMIGYEDGLFKPNSNITRAEVSTIFFRMLTDSSRSKYWSTTNAFDDVKSTDWYNNAISTLVNAGVITEKSGNYRPNENMTRAELAVMMTKFFNVEGTLRHKFDDIAGHWAENEIAKVAEKGWIEGYGDGTFRPDRALTRAEAVKLINALLDRVARKDKLLSNMKTWPDVNVDDWFYAEVQEATNSHEYERANAKSVETWLKILSARDWAALEKEWSKVNN